MFNMIPYRSSNNVVRYDPLNDEFFRSFFGPFSGGLSFRVDVKDDGDAYQLKADMPGFQKDQIHVDLNEDVLTISAGLDENREEKNENGYVLRERRTGAVRRSFNVKGIDKDAISARYENGVLQLSLPKEKPDAAAKRVIEIN